MAEYNVNRGIGKPAEFKGLKSQYLFIFAGGLLGLFVVFVIMYMAGIGQWECIAFGVASALVLVYGTFYLNGKYGEHGLMKAQARRNHPRYVINRRSIPRLFRVADPFKTKNHE
jgi:uncharacterized membrane protein YdcZ (DUF606 family)